jgi:hypothetical protein
MVGYSKNHMEILKYFFECSFNESERLEDLDEIIHKFRNREIYELQLQLIRELHQIMQTNNYNLAALFIDKYGGRIFDEEKTKNFINFLYDKFLDQSTDVKPQDFKKNCKVIYCPICTPNIEKAITFSLIEKATIIANELQIYICRPCKLVWLTENIQADNAQDYKKFMRTFGLKGLWKELKDIDYL